MAQPETLLSAPAGGPSPKGHPRGLWTLFLTEMWERFSYYGMRALLVLFMVDAGRGGGLGLTDEVATAIYGLYTAGVYLAALPGGWVADRFLGAQRAVLVWRHPHRGGQLSLRLRPWPRPSTSGLLLVVLGTGLLKPNVSAIVGSLYPPGDTRRDAGFSIFYMGINLGAFLGPLVSGYLGKRFGWHVGFAAAGVGMILGLVQFRLSKARLGEAGVRPGHIRGPRRKDWLLLAVLGGGIVGAAGLALAGVLRPNPVALAHGTTYLIGGIAGLYFLAAFLLFDLDAGEKKRMLAILVLVLASAMFFSGFEQAGSSLNLFAKRYTQRTLLGFEVPAEWFQSLGPLFVIALAPLMTALLAGAGPAWGGLVAAGEICLGAAAARRRVPGHGGGLAVRGGGTESLAHLADHDLSASHLW